jgi:CRP-like cAMP-binding protein
VVFSEGDPGNQLFVVTKGAASAYMQTPNGNIRLTTFVPGTMFGELALLDRGARSATVVADEELICYVLTTSNFAALSAQFPNLAIRLLAAVGSELSGRLRTANRTIHQLET